MLPVQFPQAARIAEPASEPEIMPRRVIRFFISRLSNQLY